VDDKVPSPEVGARRSAQPSDGMTKRLRLQLERDPDGLAELFVEVANAGFAGIGSAWFSLQQLREFGRSLEETFPIPHGTSLVLAGGYWNSTQPASLEQKHIGISFYPIGGTGTVGVHVELQTALQHDERPESQCSVRTELKTQYEPMRRFGTRLVALVEGNTKVAELDLDAV